MQTKTRSAFLFFGLAVIFIAVLPLHAFADGSCLSLNNGGVTTQQFCPTPTVLPTPAPFKENIPQQTSGGQTIYPANQTKTTPNTGPEAWSLPALFFLGGLGFLLRNKAKA